MARTGVPKTSLVGLVAGSLALLLAACGVSPQAGVANLGNAKTTAAAQSAPAGAGGGGDAPNAGIAPLNGRSQSDMVMAGGNFADMLRFANCMRSHGMPGFPDPSSNGTISVSGTVSQSAQFQAADNTCRELLPNGGIPTAAQQAQGLAQLLKFSVCMRAHGISDFPDPTSEGTRIPVRKGMPSDLARTTPGSSPPRRPARAFSRDSRPALERGR